MRTIISLHVIACGERLNGTSSLSQFQLVIFSLAGQTLHTSHPHRSVEMFEIGENLVYAIDRTYVAHAKIALAAIEYNSQFVALLIKF